MSAAFSIIVAHPEPSRCESRCSLLREAGWAVISAFTAETTYGHVTSGGVSLLVLDSAIMCEDGTDLCHKVKEANPHLLVLHTTSQAFESCADGYLCEPIEPSVLLAACRSMLRLRDAHHALEERTAHLKLAQEAASLAVVDWNLDTNCAVWSENTNEMLGTAGDGTDGPVALDALIARVHADDRERVVGALVQLRRDGGTFDEEFRFIRGDGHLRWIFVRGEFVLGSRATAPRMLSALFDVTERKKIEASNALLAAVVTSSGDAIIGMDTTSRLISWNNGATALFGYEASEAIGQNAELLVPDDMLAERFDLLERLREGESVECQTVRRRKDGRPVHVWLRASPIRSADGRLVGFSGIYRDMTDVRHRGQHVQQLLGELAHRSKNLMALIHAMARHSQSSSPSTEEFVEKFIDRLRSLSVSHDLLSNDDWRGAPVRDLVRQQLGCHAEWLGSRIQFDGPDLSLLPAAAQTIGMALHELSSNAVRHGALSGPHGSIEVNWRLTQCGAAGPWFKMGWREQGGPAVRAPIRRGFGHTVVGRITGQALGGVSTLEFPGDGIRWTLEAPAAAVVRETEGPPADPDDVHHAPAE